MAQKKRIVKSIRRHSPEIAAGYVRKLIDLGVATVGNGIYALTHPEKEATACGTWLKDHGYGTDLGAFLENVKPAWTLEGGIAPTIAGPVQIGSMGERSNRFGHYLYTLCQPGDLMFAISSGEGVDRGCFGDLMATGMTAERHGAAALVVLGGVRDVADFFKMKFPVWSSAVTARQAEGSFGEGWINAEAVTVGGVRMRPGDYLLMGPEGGLVIPFEWVEEILTAAEAKQQKEGTTREAMRTTDSVDYYAKWRANLEEGAEIIEDPIEYE